MYVASTRNQLDSLLKLQVSKSFEMLNMFKMYLVKIKICPRSQIWLTIRIISEKINHLDFSDYWKEGPVDWNFFDSILIIKFKEAFVSFLNPYFTIKRISFCDKKDSNLIARPPPIPIALLARAPRWGRIDFDSAWRRKNIWRWFWWKHQEKVLCCQLTTKR